MEYLPGMSLAELVERFGPLPPARVIHLLRQTCDALGEAHAAGLIHRDIKPGNIFAAHRGGVYDVAKLLDFGLVKPLGRRAARALDHRRGHHRLAAVHVARAGHRRRRTRRPQRHLFSGRGGLLPADRPAAVRGDKPIKVMIAHVHEAVIPPSKRGVDVPEDLEQVILRCLAKKPADRYPGRGESRRRPGRVRVGRPLEPGGRPSVGGNGVTASHALGQDLRWSSATTTWPPSKPY